MTGVRICTGLMPLQRNVSCSLKVSCSLTFCVSSHFQLSENVWMVRGRKSRRSETEELLSQLLDCQTVQVVCDRFIWVLVRLYA